MAQITRHRRLEFRSPQVLADTSQAMSRWAHRRLPWWQRPPTPAAQPDGAEGPPAGEPVVLAVDGQVATVTVNRPERRNALNLAVWQSLTEIAERLAAEASSGHVRVVVLTGAGDKAFSAGSDIAEFTESRLGAAAARRYSETYEAALQAWAALPQPVVARIAGYCLGAGLELALTADFRIAAQDAILGIPAAKLGIGISVADARRLIDVVGPARARALLLSGDRVTADEALALGLVNDVLPADELDARVQAQVRSLLDNAPLTMAWVKQAVSFAMRHPDAESVPFDVLGTHLFTSRDCEEGVQAFLAHRRPQFTGA
ncbi:MAG: enoyl-CoA hydratase/isomerase family protein [Chloroflexota bacterium]